MSQSPLFYRFMWIMGFCIPMSVRSAEKRGAPLIPQLWNILVRSAKLFLLGFIFGNANWINLARVRIPGVLQRFAFTYLVVASSCAIIARVMSDRRRGKRDEEEEGANEQENVRSRILHYEGCLCSSLITFSDGLTRLRKSVNTWLSRVV